MLNYMSFKSFTLKLSLHRIYLFLILLLISFTAQSQWKYPSDNWKTIGPPKGSLYIIGGAAASVNYQQFIKMAGGPNASIVLITTAGDDVGENNSAYKRLIEEGAKNLTILHTKDKNVANTEAFVAPLKKAKAVMIGGGFQVRLAKAYLHTLTHKALFDVLDRGGVIAGSSAGASIQGSYLYGGQGETEGFGFIKESAIGQHYVRRNRMGSVAKILKNNSKLIGFGIDEATGIIVRGNDIENHGESKTAIYDATRDDFDKPNTQAYLFPGDKFDLKTREITSRTKANPTDLWANARKPFANPARRWANRISPKGKVLVYGSEIFNDLSLKNFYENVDTKSIVLLSSGNKEHQAKTEAIEKSLKQMGAKNVTILHTINPDEANSLAFAKPLTAATAVLLCGGEKWQFANNYLNTLVHKELFSVLARNGTIASAMYTAPILTSRLFGEAFWSRGFSLINNSLLYGEQLTSKNTKTLNELLTKDEKLTAIRVNKENILAFENGYVSVFGAGAAHIRSGADKEGKKISTGNKETL